MIDPFASDGAFLVDARGVLMKEKKLLPEYLGLPLILGCSSESLDAGKVVESPEAKAALELLRLSTRSFMQTRFQIREIDVSKGYCLVVTDKNRTRVTFGFEDLETQLQRLEKFLVYSDDTKQELATVNLLVQRNIPGHVREIAGRCDQRHGRSCGDPHFVTRPRVRRPHLKACPHRRPVEHLPRAKNGPSEVAGVGTRLQATPAARNYPIRRAIPVEQKEGET